MIKIDPTRLIILGEVILGLLIFLVGGVVIFIKLKKRDKKRVAELKKRLKKNGKKSDDPDQELLPAIKKYRNFYNLLASGS